MSCDYKQYNYNATYCGGSFASQGCGPTSVADLLEISPLTVADWMTANGYATTDGHGTYWGGINAALAAYGKDGKMLGSSMDGTYDCSIFEQWKNVIKSGCEGVLLMHNVVSPMWTTSGHYIAVVGYDANTDQYLVYDPASTVRTGWHPFSDFAGNICCLYTSSCRWGEPEPDDTHSFKVSKIKGGSQGKKVKLLQRLLCSRGMYPQKKIDGSYGDLTIKAVIKYQQYIKDHGGKLKVTGECDSATWTNILGIAGNPKVVHQVQAGDKNIYVYLAQELLSADGYYQGVCDQSYGRATEASVRAFQKKKKIAVDGVCGPTTFKKLIGF